MIVVQFRRSILIDDLRLRKGGSAARAPVHGKSILVDQSPVEQSDERNLGEPAVVLGVGLIIYRGIHGFAQYLELPRHLVNVVLCKFFA